MRQFVKPVRLHGESDRHKKKVPLRLKFFDSELPKKSTSPYYKQDSVTTSKSA
jgi:hypothetical protein